MKKTLFFLVAFLLVGLALPFSSFADDLCHWWGGEYCVPRCLQYSEEETCELDNLCYWTENDTCSLTCDEWLTEETCELDEWCHWEGFYCGFLCEEYNGQQELCELDSQCYWTDGYCFLTCYQYTSSQDCDGTTGAAPIISIPGGFIGSILAYAGRLFTDFEAFVILLIGLPVGFFVIKKAIALVKKRIK